MVKRVGPYGLNINKQFLESLHEGSKWCPHCGQQASFKKHRVNRATVDFLRLLDAAVCKYGDGFFTTRSLVPRAQKMQKISTDATAVCRYLSLVEVSDDVPEKKAPKGSYRILPTGREFLMGRVHIPEYVLVYNACVVTTADYRIYVHQAWGAEYNYAEQVAGIEVGIQSGKGIPVGRYGARCSSS